jgi:hypothetical protein
MVEEIEEVKTPKHVTSDKNPDKDFRSGWDFRMGNFGVGVDLFVAVDLRNPSHPPADECSTKYAETVAVACRNDKVL